MIVKTDSGCKVGWTTTDNLAEATNIAERAKRRAREMLLQGYDFGYQSPGEIRESTLDGKKVWIVTTP